MTGREVASLFGAKRISRGRWLALCTAHPDRKPSLSITEGRKAVLLRCQSQQCAVRDICQSAGITVQSLWYQQSADPKAIREAEKRREYDSAVRSKLVLQLRDRIADLERWSRIAAALYWHLLRNPHDIRLSGWYEEALDRCRSEPSPWPKHQPYCPFPPLKLLHGITSRQVSHPQIARFLKLKG